MDPMTDHPLVLTSSDLDLYLSCRRAWRWSYVDNFNLPDKEVGAYALGSRVHAALEEFYRTGADPAEVHERLGRESLERLGLADAPSWDFDTLYDDIIVGRNCVAAYMEWLTTTGADAGLTVEGVEEKLEAPILDGRVLLRGKIDLRLRRESDGVLQGTDFKTSGTQMKMVHHRLERSYQPVIYDWLVELVTGETVAAATFRVIKKVSRRQHGTPMVDEFSVPGALRSRARRRAQIERIALEILSLTEKLQSGAPGSDAIAYPHPDDACGWCQYKDPCRLADEDPLAANDMLRDLFTSGRYARYDSTDDTTETP